MTRKDYVLIAAAIRKESGPRDHESPYNHGKDDGVVRVAAAIADSLASENRAFDPQRFLRACGVSR